MKTNSIPSLNSPKNRYHVEVHYDHPLEGIGSVVSFGTMNIDSIDEVIRRYWMNNQPSVHVVISENMKTFPRFDWKVVRDEHINA